MKLQGPFFIILGALLTITSSNSQAASDADCIVFPLTYHEFGTVTTQKLNNWIPNLRYAVNTKYLSIDKELTDSQTHLRQQFVPSHVGTDPVVASINIAEGRTYIVNQTVKFEKPFDWGGLHETGKFGFGLGGGSVPSGGQLRSDGFSVRLMWKGNSDGTANIGAYVYSSDRSQNLPWGDEYIIDGFEIPQDEWIKLKLVVTTNSTLKNNDGTLAIWINDEVMLWEENIHWQRSGDKPVIEQLLYSTFYGGGGPEWSPGYVTHAQFTDVCYSAY